MAAPAARDYDSANSGNWVFWVLMFYNCLVSNGTWYLTWILVRKKCCSLRFNTLSNPSPYSLLRYFTFFIPVLSGFAKNVFFNTLQNEVLFVFVLKGKTDDFPFFSGESPFRSIYHENLSRSAHERNPRRR